MLGDIKSCTGCGACVVLCPRSSISMVEDSEGFYRPHIDENSCIHCDLCSRLCPAEHEVSNTNIRQEAKAFAYIHPNVDVLEASSSGGAFYAIASYVLSCGGTVFGAVYDDDFHVVHIGTNQALGLSAMHGSKYVQSRAEESYREVEILLKAGKPVLFSGTPCQIAGLYATLNGENYGNLFTVEILCHGVPNDRLFHAYLDALEQSGKHIMSYTFRDKEKWGWGNWGSYTYTKSDRKACKKKRFVVANDYYYLLYFKGINFRESCYVCKYATLPRLADVTIGDFWGVSSVLPEIDINKGVSLIISNTDVGDYMVKNTCEKSALIQLDIGNVIPLNQTIVKATTRPKERDTFYVDFNRLGFLPAAKKYCKLSALPVLTRYMPRRVKDAVKQMINK